MRRVAAHEVVMPNGLVIAPGVVEICDSEVQSVYPLELELDYTEWVGGTVHIQCVNSRLQAYKNNNVLI